MTFRQSLDCGGTKKKRKTNRDSKMRGETAAAQQAAAAAARGPGVLGSWGLVLDSGVVGPGVPRKKKLESWGPGVLGPGPGFWGCGSWGAQEKKKRKKQKKKGRKKRPRGGAISNQHSLNNLLKCKLTSFCICRKKQCHMDLFRKKRCHMNLCNHLKSNSPS